MDAFVNGSMAIDLNKSNLQRGSFSPPRNIQKLLLNLGNLGVLVGRVMLEERSPSLPPPDSVSERNRRGRDNTGKHPNAFGFL